MTPLLIILAQTQTGAMIEILILLLIAGAIAYFTAYYYYKPIYTRKITALENEKLDLEKLNIGLRSEIEKLDDKLKEKEKEIAELKEKLR